MWDRLGLGLPSPNGEIQAKVEETWSTKGSKSEIQHWLSQQCSSDETVQAYKMKRYSSERRERRKMDMNEGCGHLKPSWSSTCQEALGRRSHKHKEWITPETLNIIQQGRKGKGEQCKKKIWKSSGSNGIQSLPQNKCSKTSGGIREHR